MATAGDLRFPSIDGLRAFEASARLGSYERAAGELAITASAVGKRVSTVEALLGQPLFTRQGKTLALTAGGREYLDQVRSALGLLSAMPLHHRAAQRLRRVRVSAPPTFARQILVPELASFTQAHPDIELEVVLSIPFLDVSPGRADVEVRAGDPDGNTVLLDDVVLPMAAPALLARLPPLQMPADLAAAPLLRTPIEPWTPWLRAAGLDWPEPTQGPKLVDLGLTLEAAVSAQGVTLGRPSLARHWLASGNLQALFGPLLRPAQLYHVVPQAHDAAARAFVDWLAARCAVIAQDALALALAQMPAAPGAGPGRRRRVDAAPRSGQT
jgi:LysR family transcriptional regulator, glycine cleavage system transcriptional activator